MKCWLMRLVGRDQGAEGHPDGDERASMLKAVDEAKRAKVNLCETLQEVSQARERLKERGK